MLRGPFLRGHNVISIHLTDADNCSDVRQRMSTHEDGRQRASTCVV